MTGSKAGGGSDEDLLRQVVRRDRRAFAHLYRRYQPRLFGYLRRLLRDGQLVEEVLDDVMFVVWKDARRFGGKSTVSTWIFGIAYRRAISALRVESRHQAPIDRTADAERMPANRTKHGDLISAALVRLSPDHRQVIELTYYFGFSYREIAEIADCPVNTVKTRMFHARRRLKYLLPVLAGDKEDSDREQA